MGEVINYCPMYQTAFRVRWMKGEVPIPQPKRKEYRVAVITYRKNVKDKWDDSLFYSVETQVLNTNVTMLLCELGTELNGSSCAEHFEMLFHDREDKWI